MLARTRFGMLAAMFGMTASLMSEIGDGSRGPVAPAVKGRTIWDSQRRGPLDVGRNAEKRTAKAHQRDRRSAQLRNAGWHQGSNLPLGHRDEAPKRKFSARRNLLADRRLRQLGLRSTAPARKAA